MPTKEYLSAARGFERRISVLKKQYWRSFGWTMYGLLVMGVNLHAYIVTDNLVNLFFMFVGLGWIYYFGNKSDNLFRDRLKEEAQLEKYRKEVRSSDAAV